MNNGMSAHMGRVGAEQERINDYSGNEIWGVRNPTDLLGGSNLLGQNQLGQFFWVELGWSNNHLIY